MPDKPISPRKIENTTDHCSHEW